MGIMCRFREVSAIVHKNQQEHIRTHKLKSSKYYLTSVFHTHY